MDAIDQQKKVQRRFLLLYGLIALTFITIGPSVFSSLHSGSGDLHHGLDIIGSCLALIAATVCFTHYLGLHNRFHLIIGLGFLLCGSQVLLHGLIAGDNQIHKNNVYLSQFINESRGSGLTVLVILSLTAVVLEPFLANVKRLRWEVLYCTGAAVLIGLIVAMIPFMMPVSHFIFPDWTIARPLEFVSALLFAVTFILMVRRFLSHRDVFTGSIAACLLLIFGGQLYMSFSRQSFDVPSEIAQWVILFGYCIPVIGMSIDLLEGMRGQQREIKERWRVEIALLESRNRFRLLSEQNKIYTWQTDADGLLTHISHVAAQVTGYQADELIGRMHLYDLHPRGGRKEFKRKVSEEFGNSERSGFLEHPIEAKEGHVVWVSSIGSPVVSVDGKLEGYRGNNTDITDLRQAKEDAVAHATQLEQSHRAAMSMMEDTEQARKDTTAALAVTETLLDTIPVGVMVIGQDGKIRRVNQEALHMIGDPPKDEIIGSESRVLLGQHEHEPKPDGDENVTYDNSEHTLITIDNQEIPILRTIVPITLDSETVLLEAFVDITQIKHAEEELRVNEEKFRAITTAAQDAIVMMDGKGNVIFWNDSAERIFGWTSPEIAGRSLHEYIVPFKYRLTYDEFFPIQGNTRKEGTVGQTLQLQACHKDGREFPIELSLSAVKLDEQWCAIGLARDISKRVKNEQSQARLKAAIEAASDMVLVTDTDGIIQYVNPAFEEISGFSREKTIGTKPSILRGNQNDDQFNENLWSTISKGEVWQGHIVNRKNDDSLFHVDAIISPIKNNDGDIINYVAVMRDVTKQMDIERQLIHSQKMESIGQLAAGIAHEINTPIQYVGDNMRFIRESLEGLMLLVNRYAQQLGSPPKSWQERAEEIKSTIDELDLEFLREEIPKAIEQSLEGVGRVARIVLAMKDFSHPGNDEKTPTNINKSIESTMTVCRNRWKYVAELETDFQDDLPMVPCLIGEFNQVMLNIIVNAADAIACVVEDGGYDKGVIIITTKRDGEYVEIMVSDTGCGIPLENTDRIYDPFFTTKDVGKGTGQGLAISHDAIVNKHGGTIDLTTKPGQGTTFIVRLPIKDLHADQHKEAA